MEKKVKNRKNYKKPQINQVNLVIEEAVLQACKIATGATGKGFKTCENVACKRDFGS